MPVPLRREANARAVASAALVRAAEGRRGCPGCRDQLGNGQAGCEDCCLKGSKVALPDQLMINDRDWVLPRQRLLWNQRAEITDDRAHVAMGQLEPRPGKC